MTGRLPVVLVLLGVLLSSGSACASISVGSTQPSAAAKPSPSPDAALVQYRNVIDGDMRAASAANQRLPCGTRPLCIADIDLMMSTADHLLNDVTRLPAPPQLATLAQAVAAAARTYIGQLDVALAVAKQPNGNYQAAVNVPNPHDLDLSVAALDCWPAQPVNPGNEGDYSCA
jgi:hypothetical protein